MDLRIMALGAMALLMAAFGASTSAHRHRGPESVAVAHERLVAGDADDIRTGSIRVIDRGTHVDGFDLKH
jgi:anti-sigma factor ChrR (cupin superfamily)